MREAVSQESAPVAFDRQPHARTEAQSRARPPQIKTKEAVRENRGVDRRDADRFENYPADKPAEQRSLKTVQVRPPKATVPRGSLPDEPAVHPPTRTAPPAERPSGPPAVKTREVYIRQQAPASVQLDTEDTVRQGERGFVQAQGRKRAVKQSERRWDLREGNARRTPQQRTENSSSPAPIQKWHGGDRDFPKQHHSVRRTTRRTGKAAEQTAQNTVRGVKASKKAAKDTGRTTKQAVKTTSRSAKQAVKTADCTVRTAQKTAQATVKATQRAVQAARRRRPPPRLRPKPPWRRLKRPLRPSRN